MAKTETKKDIATKIYKRHKNPTRAVVLPKFIAAGIPEAGASTYYQHLKLGRWG